MLLPVYNHARYVGHAIECVLAQHRRPDEFLILDDASTDESAEIIQAYADRNACINFVRSPHNLGVLGANAKLDSMATGEYIFFTAADDYLLPGFFEAAMESVQRHPDAGVVFGDLIVRLPSGAHFILRAKKWPQPLFASPAAFLTEFLEHLEPTSSMAPATIYRRSALRQIGGFREELGPWADTFAIRTLGLMHGAVYLGFPCALFRMLPGSQSSGVENDAALRLDVGARAMALMRSDEFRHVFPEWHVRRWWRRYVVRVTLRGCRRAFEQHEYLKSLKTLGLLFYRPPSRQP